jgi:hypothetical protein
MAEPQGSAITVSAGRHATRRRQPQLKPEPGGAEQLPPPVLPPARVNRETPRNAFWPQIGQGISSSGCRWIFSVLAPQLVQRYSKIGILRFLPRKAFICGNLYNIFR